VSRVDFSSGSDNNWQQAQLAKDEGKYSFRQWQIALPPRPGDRMR
jgi:hypothetical protein